MKALIFSHKPDIDGAGGVILAMIAFGRENVVYELCETFEINDKIKKYIDDGSIYSFDNIYVTDICIKEPLISIIDKDEKLKGKIKVFDHHKSEIQEGLDKYDFVKLVVEDEKGRCCGTSLFYNYLNDLCILKSINIVSEFVELTRQYDTWEWKTKYNNEIPRELTILFDLISPHKYIEKMYLKLSENINFEFTDDERNLIDIEKHKIEAYVDKAISNMEIKKCLGIKYGVIFAELYRNEIKLEIKERKIDVDFIAIIKMYDKTISYRQINNDFDVSLVSQAFGGKGHKEAASSPLSSKIINSLIRKVFGLKMFFTLLKLKK